MNCRLPPQPTEWIDRTRSIPFTFEGRQYIGFFGDTISSALCANGVRLLGRSFKYHRPRGIYSLANTDVNVMVQDSSRTNLRGDVTPLSDNLDVKAVNTFGGLLRDRAKIVDRFGKFLPVGFYYKTFHHPQRWFPFFERQMRKMAGLGNINPNLPRHHTPKAYDFCDVLVVGAGPAGLSAAMVAAKAGAQVVVVDENSHAGGCLNYQFATNELGATTLNSLLDQVRSFPNLDLRTSTMAAGYYADHWIALVNDKQLVKLRARAVVLASGCFEQPAVFGNNDLPGVMLASSVQRLIHQFSVKPFNTVIVFAANTEGYRAALDFHRVGIKVAAIVDPRDQGEPTNYAQQVTNAGIRIYVRHAVAQAVPGNHKSSVRAAMIAPLNERCQPDLKQALQIEADGVAMSVGWAPADGLFYQAGGRMSWSEPLQQFIPSSSPPGLFTAGRINGVYDIDQQMIDGQRAGAAAATHLNLVPQGSWPEPIRPTASPTFPHPVFPHPRAKNFVDLDEDVQYKDFVNAAQEGFDHVELMKRYSTYGMGPSQGKIANTNAIRILAKIKGQTIPETGVTTSRPFYHPVPLSHLAGRGFHIQRHTPLHSRHQAAGASFLLAGEWERPAFYSIPGQSREAAIAKEVLAVRNQVGLIDVGTLGKIEINGPDAGTFIDRLYTGRFSNLKIGSLSYGLMCDETGVVIDDGLICRFADDRYYITTTTTGSSAIYRELQRWAILWQSNVVLTNVTGCYGAVDLAGPNSRSVLRQLTDLELSSESFPYLAVRQAKVTDVPARILRVGFVGEWGYEIHMPAFGIPRLWDALFGIGKPHGLRCFGVEAQRVLRLEKADIIVGQDTDGLTTPTEANMRWSIKANKPFFVGKRSLEIFGQKALKRKLVGFVVDNNQANVESTEFGASSNRAADSMVKECHLIILQGQMIGRVTSVAYSPTLKQTIGLAFITPGKALPNTKFEIRVDNGSTVAAKVVETPFYDPKALRQLQSVS